MTIIIGKDIFSLSKSCLSSVLTISAIAKINILSNFASYSLFSHFHHSHSNKYYHWHLA